ncbi:Uncharacterised protein [Legionella pneumophila subsp. pascullei]|uniref:Uncharacterized protein n=1 Tax=Legionella pneumophila subsp. pascullei TaxID=91890 RepID=A0AAX2IZC2_LEGPN|nr:Uncharacterised protein [Legionella pneumophila subsp. pascullei]VEH07767.1 Uncharacterised protein [Legionella pneumophila subsp. pascullei]
MFFLLTIERLIENMEHNLILMIYISDKDIKFINIEKNICI